ncbi:MAG: hypothetical protein HZA35_03780 [Parcubacteria group bacterium]|nr:hypothetical protein [Parcubacteria group bacterium]
MSQKKEDDSVQEEGKTMHINIFLFEKTKKVLEELCTNTSQSRSVVVRVALELLYFVLTKVCDEEYEVHLVHKTTKDVIVLPIYK